MGQIKVPAPVKLIIGLLGSDRDLMSQVRKRLSDQFGPEEEIMEPIPFTWTNYYEDELGPSPWRAFVSYEPLIDREAIVEIKKRTNELEGELSLNAKRRINFDPGYMTLGQFLLATTKDQRQRVYVGQGIFVEPTLYFENGAFHNFAWTYRDYCSDVYHAYFMAARLKLAYQRRHGGKPYSTRHEKNHSPN